MVQTSKDGVFLYLIHSHLHNKTILIECKQIELMLLNVLVKTMRYEKYISRSFLC